MKRIRKTEKEQGSKTEGSRRSSRKRELSVFLILISALSNGLLLRMFSVFFFGRTRIEQALLLSSRAVCFLSLRLRLRLEVAFLGGRPRRYHTFVFCLSAQPPALAQPTHAQPTHACYPPPRRPSSTCVWFPRAFAQDIFYIRQSVLRAFSPRHRIRPSCDSRHRCEAEGSSSRHGTALAFASWPY